MFYVKQALMTSCPSNGVKNLYSDVLKRFDATPEVLCVLCGKFGEIWGQRFGSLFYTYTQKEKGIGTFVSLNRCSPSPMIASGKLSTKTNNRPYGMPPSIVVRD